jgi:hypothetical protein
MNIFKRLSEKGYKHYTENTVEELDELPNNHSDIITEYAHLCEWLRVNHGIWVYSFRHDENIFYWSIDTIEREFTAGDSFNTPQEAYSAAFDYILNNDLI